MCLLKISRLICNEMMTGGGNCGMMDSTRMSQMRIFKGGRRRELQQEIDSLDFQIANMKKRLSSIVKEVYKVSAIGTALVRSSYCFNAIMV